jgi:hypothetical protein
MYIAMQERVIGAVLLQEEDGKEFLVAYVSRRLLDAETRYVFMEKLCLSLYYAWSKFRHYILSCSCIVACQYNVIKHMLQSRGHSQCLDGVLNSYRNRCLDIIKLFDTFSIKHIPREENSQIDQLAQQASGYLISQGVFWVASVSLVEHRYALRSKGKPVLENSDRLQDEKKPIPDNMNRLPEKTGPDSGKTEPESGSGKAELESGKIEPGQGYEIGLWEEAKLTSVERFKKESVTKKDEVEKDGSPLDEGKTKLITKGDSVKGGDMIRTDWRLPLLESTRDPGKTTDKKIKWQALKYTSLDDDLY